MAGKGPVKVGSPPTPVALGIFLLLLAGVLLSVGPACGQVRLNRDVLVASAPARRAPSPLTAFDGRQLTDSNGTVATQSTSIGSEDSALRGRELASNENLERLLGEPPANSEAASVGTLVPELNVAEPGTYPGALADDDVLGGVAESFTTTEETNPGVDGQQHGDGISERRRPRRRRPSEREPVQQQLRDEGRRPAEYAMRRTNEAPGKRGVARRRPGGAGPQQRWSNPQPEAAGADELFAGDDDSHKRQQLPLPPSVPDDTRWQIAESALRVLFDEDTEEEVLQSAAHSQPEPARRAAKVTRSLEDVANRVDRHEVKFRQLSELLSALLGQNNNRRSNQQPGDIIGGMVSRVVDGAASVLNGNSNNNNRRMNTQRQPTGLVGNAVSRASDLATGIVERVTDGGGFINGLLG